MISMKIDTAIIIAGGKSNRLKSLDIKDSEPNIPKPMIEVLGKPILEYNINWLKKHGVKNIIIGVAFKKEKIMEYLGDGKKFDVNIIYSNHDPDDGTADAFRKAIENTNLKEKYFYAMNSDQFTDFSLGKLFERHISAQSQPLATVLLVNPTCPFGMVKVNENGFITSFEEKPKLDDFTNGGIYVFDIEIKKYLEGDVERKTFVQLSKMRKLHSIKYSGFWDTINTFKDLARVEETLKKNENLRRYYSE